MEQLMAAIFASLMSDKTLLVQETPLLTATERRKQHLWALVTSSESVIRSAYLSKIFVLRLSCSIK